MPTPPTPQPPVPGSVAGVGAGQRRDLLDRLLDRLAPGSLVLAAGWGIGADLSEITARGYHAAGVEADGPPLESCRRLGTATYAGRLSSLPFAPGSFDAVWLRTGVGDLSAAAAPLALAEMRRVLRPGGLLFAVAPVAQAETFVPVVPVAPVVPLAPVVPVVPQPRRATGSHSFAHLVRTTGFRVEIVEVGEQGLEEIGAHAT